MRSNGAAVPLLTLTDTGPLVALIDEDDPYFAKAGAALALLPKRPLVTTSSCFTEAMYLLHRTGGTLRRTGCGSFMSMAWFGFT